MNQDPPNLTLKQTDTSALTEVISVENHITMPPTNDIADPHPLEFVHGQKEIF